MENVRRNTYEKTKNNICSSQQTKIDEIILYAVVETLEKEERNVLTAPELWIDGTILYWPPKGAFTKRKNPTPPEPGWIVIECKILERSFSKYVENIDLDLIFYQNIIYNSITTKCFEQRKSFVSIFEFRI